MMWRIFRIHKIFQWIQTLYRHMRRNRQFVLISVSLTICIIVVVLLLEYENKCTKDVQARNCVLERESKSLQQFIGILKESNQYISKNIENVNSFRVDGITLLTLFTSWVDRTDKYIVQNRTVENWISFGQHIRPVIFTNDIKLGGQCNEKGWNVLPLKQTAAQGVPILKYMYIDAMQHFNSVFYGFANSDILFNDGLIETLVTIKEFIELNGVSVLVTGRRINVDYKHPCNASDWRNITSVSKKGELVTPVSADYFITTKAYPWEEMDEIIIGRIRIDNWIIQFSQLKRVTVIDSTPTILALHQTTETGNAEGESKSNKFFNDDVVRRVRNISINVNQGRTDCAEYVTNFTRSKLVRLVKQTPQILCKDGSSSTVKKGIFLIHLMNCVVSFFVLFINK